MDQEMAKREDGGKGMFEFKVPKWVFWGVIFLFIYASSLFIAYDLGKRSSRSGHWDIKGKEVKKEKGKSIRVPPFVPPEKVRHQPRFSFTYDSEEVLRPLRDREKLDEVVAGAKADLEVFLKLMNWVRTQWFPGVPDPYPPINATIILDKIRKGETGGFCAQYCFVLAQCLQSLGYKARYVTVKGHEVIEVWSPELAKWVMLDPLHELYVRRGMTPLSVLEIHNNIVRGDYDLEVYALKGPEDRRDYLSRFGKFAVWMKNDHLSSPINFFDIDRYKIFYLDDPSERIYVPGGSLYTFFPEDLYFNPLMR